MIFFGIIIIVLIICYIFNAERLSLLGSLGFGVL